jgi:hypothetical protein
MKVSVKEASTSGASLATVPKRSKIDETLRMVLTTSIKQIEANCRNARKSTGPITGEGKRQSRGNAVRHGVTAETVIGA